MNYLVNTLGNVGFNGNIDNLQYYISKHNSFNLDYNVQGLFGEMVSRPTVQNAGIEYKDTSAFLITQQYQNPACITILDTNKTLYLGGETDIRCKTSIWKSNAIPSRENQTRFKGNKNKEFPNLDRGHSYLWHKHTTDMTHINDWMKELHNHPFDEQSYDNELQDTIITNKSVRLEGTFHIRDKAKLINTLLYGDRLVISGHDIEIYNSKLVFNEIEIRGKLISNSEYLVSNKMTLEVENNQEMTSQFYVQGLNEKSDEVALDVKKFNGQGNFILGGNNNIQPFSVNARFNNSKIKGLVFINGTLDFRSEMEGYLICQSFVAKQFQGFYGGVLMDAKVSLPKDSLEIPLLFPNMKSFVFKERGDERE